MNPRWGVFDGVDDWFFTPSRSGFDSRTLQPPPLAACATIVVAWGENLATTSAGLLERAARFFYFSFPKSALEIMICWISEVPS